MINALKRVSQLLGFSVVLLFASVSGNAGEINKSPFSGMEGQWKGRGSITPPGGQSERVNCRVNYNVFGNGNKATQNIRCAGAGYWITAVTKLRYTPGTRKLRGSWSANYGEKSSPAKTGGTVLGDYIDDTISISLNSESFTGGMRIVVSGSEQRVSIDGLAELRLSR